MPSLVPDIHASPRQAWCRFRHVDGRDEPGHDGFRLYVHHYTTEWGPTRFSPDSPAANAGIHCVRRLWIPALRFATAE
jgi:hypothetical protein